MNDGKLYYDQGWDARVRGEPYDRNATIDWKDGWRDCEEAPAEDRILFDEATE